MPNNATVTGKTGPAAQVTAVPFRNISEVNIDIARQVISFGQGGNRKEIDLAGITNISVSLNGQNSSIVLT